MKGELTFNEVDVGFYMGFIEEFRIENNHPILTYKQNEVLSQDGSCEERWCICDPNESFCEITSGLFDTYIALENDLMNTKFLGSFKTFKEAESHLNNLFQKGYKFETVPVFESDYYTPNYSEKKQSIFI